MYLVDTNVISEARKRARANPGVQAFFQSQQAGDLYICVQTIGEIRRGIENIRRRDSSQAGHLGSWLTGLVDEYADRILYFDTDCAHVWGRLMSPDGARWRPCHR